MYECLRIIEESSIDISSRSYFRWICWNWVPEDAHVKRSRRWSIELEVENPSLLNETGKGQPTSIDVVLKTSKQILTIESKFDRDASEGFGPCGQANSEKSAKCAGFYGPGSDLKRKTNAWCRLEGWDKGRSPRLYWSLGKAYFKPEIFNLQKRGEWCPFAGSNYQLMRNFLFAATLAQRERKDSEWWSCVPNAMIHSSRRKLRDSCQTF